MAEIIACPNCERRLQVPEQYLGQAVQCPECRHMFSASSPSVSAQPIPPPAPPAASKARRRDEEPDDEFPRKSRRRFDDEDDDLEDYDNPRRRGRRPYTPHRGGLVMALGLIGLVGGMSFFLPVVVGPVAWIMGNHDLREIREGRMDPTGEGMTRAGQICGMVATVFLILGILFLCLIFAASMG